MRKLIIPQKFESKSGSKESESRQNPVLGQVLTLNWRYGKLINMREDRIREGWREWLASNNRGWRIIVGAICAVCLAFFLHFREVRLEVLELNATAGRYIVAQVDFEFPDYETTIILKQQAMQDIGKIYQIDDKQIREVRYELEESLIHNKDWRAAAPSSTFEEMYKAADEIETLLLESPFYRSADDPKDQGTQHFRMRPITNLSLRMESTGSSLRILEADSPANRQQAILSTEKPSPLSSMRFEQQALGAYRRFGFGAFDPSQVSRTVPEKMTQVQAGTRIIDPGRTGSLPAI